jgi:hypothetical protein
MSMLALKSSYVDAMLEVVACDLSLRVRPRLGRAN